MVRSAPAMLGVAWILFSLAGAGVLAFVDGPGRRLLVPACPAIGAATLAALLHWPGLVMPTKAAVPLLLLTAVGAAVAFRRRFKFGDRVRGLPWRMLVVVSALGAVPLLVGLEPQTRAGGPRVVQATWNNDAYAYVSLADWLQDHSALERATVPPDAPAHAYSGWHLDFGLRLGEEFLHAAVATVTGNEPDRTWYTISAGWIFLLPGTMAAAAGLLGARPLVGALGGFVAATSALTLFQLYNQNSASLLGIAIAPLALALLVARLDGTGPWRPPRWLVALALAGLFAAYSEYAPIVGAGGALLLLVRQPRRIVPAAAEVVRLGALALLMAPFVWYRVLRSLSNEADVVGDIRESAFLDVPAWTIVSRLTGVIPQDDGGHSLLALVLCGLAAAGIALAARSPAGRRLLPFVVASGALIYTLGSIRRFPYGHQRAVEISLVLFVLMASVGISCLFPRRDAQRSPASVRPRNPMAGRLASVLAVGVVLVFSWTNVATARKTGRGPLALARNVDSSFYEAVGWVRDVAEDGGGNVMVVDSGFFPQLWMVFLLRGFDDVSFPFIHPDYVPGVGPRHVWDGRLRRYALVGVRDFVDSDDGVVIAENARYRLLDLSRGETVMAMPLTGFNDDEPLGDGRYGFWMAAEARLLVLRTPDAAVRLTLWGRSHDALPEVTLEASTDAGELLARDVVTNSADHFTVRLPPGPETEVVIRVGAPGEPSIADPRLPKQSFYIAGVTRG